MTRLALAPCFALGLFLALAPTQAASATSLEFLLTDEQQALLGCGPFYGTPCETSGGTLLLETGASVLIRDTHGVLSWNLISHQPQTPLVPLINGPLRPDPSFPAAGNGNFGRVDCLVDDCSGRGIYRPGVGIRPLPGVAAVPEPGAALLFAVGLACLSRVRRRSR